MEKGAEDCVVCIDDDFVNSPVTTQELLAMLEDRVANENNANNTSEENSTVKADHASANKTKVTNKIGTSTTAKKCLISPAPPCEVPKSRKRKSAMEVPATNNKRSKSYDVTTRNKTSKGNIEEAEKAKKQKVAPPPAKIKLSKNFGVLSGTFVTEFNGRVVGSKPLDVALAQSKEARKTNLDSHYMSRYTIQPNIQYGPPSTPYIFPAINPGPRLFNYIPPYSAIPSSSDRVASRQSIQNNNLRNAAIARPITGQTFKPNTVNIPDCIRRPIIGLNNGSDSIPINTDALATATPQNQKQIIGKRLFEYVNKMCPESAYKITGMLLDMDNSELLNMMDNQESLRAKVEEALAVLQTHQTTKSSLVQN